jgi:hypothetical protein
VHSRLSILETLQAVAGWYTQVLQLSRFVQIEQFAPGCPAKAEGKCPGDLRATIIEKVFRKSVSKGHDHVSMLSELDKISCKKFPVNLGIQNLAQPLQFWWMSHIMLQLLR